MTYVDGEYFSGGGQYSSVGPNLSRPRNFTSVGPGTHPEDYGSLSGDVGPSSPSGSSVLDDDEDDEDLEDGRLRLKLPVSHKSLGGSPPYNNNSEPNTAL